MRRDVLYRLGYWWPLHVKDSRHNPRKTTKNWLGEQIDFQSQECRRAELNDAQTSWADVSCIELAVFDLFTGAMIQVAQDADMTSDSK